MTTLETIMIICAVLIVLLLGIIAYRVDALMNNALAFFIRTGRQLDKVRADMYDDVGNNYLVEIMNRLDNIKDDITDDRRDIVAMLKSINDMVDKMHRNLCAEIADKMVDRVYPPTYVTPCYAPDGICLNPQMDCINCPRRGEGGQWTTTSNKIKEDEK